MTLTRRAALRAGVVAVAGTALLPAVRATATEVHATNPADLSLLEVLAELESHRLSGIELTEACLARIDALEPTLQAFVARTDERALAAARAADGLRAGGQDPGLLGGVPVGLKDLYYTAGVPTTASSRVLADFVPDFDATVWARMAQRGAGLAGKLNTHEFAYGTSTPPTRNPWDPERNPGGSSGGSGAALGARMLPVATGSDTGGSLRLPAAVNGICAIRPTYGAVSRRGIIALAWSLDTVAPMARRMADVSLLLAAVAGHDPADPTSSDIPLGELPLSPPSLAGVRVGVPDDYFWDDVEGGIAAVCREGLALLERLGAGAARHGAAVHLGWRGRPGRARLGAGAPAGAPADAAAFLTGTRGQQADCREMQTQPRAAAHHAASSSGDPSVAANPVAWTPDLDTAMTGVAEPAPASAAVSAVSARRSR